jgi:poly-gamma-glutamate synthesis protein (capsule biosynthesis protein)
MPQAQTTSYIVQIYEPEAPAPPAWPAAPADALWFFAGDTFLGRGVATMLAHPARAEAMRSALLHLTQGHPLAINLEGVLVKHMPDPARLPHALLMDESFTLEWLKALHVKLAGLANNHALDGGAAGLEETAQALAAAGIIPVRAGEVVDAGRFRAVALTDFSNTAAPFTERITRRAIAHLPPPAYDARPFFALLHWGAEFRTESTPRQTQLLEWLGPSSVDAIFGAHPHVDSRRPEPWRGGDGLVCRSLGNFLFDQRTGSGALAEVRFFEQQTFAVRWIPLGTALHDAMAQEPTAAR